jgi:uncharacterized protein (DUF934 family)
VWAGWAGGVAGALAHRAGWCGRLRAGGVVFHESIHELRKR